MHFGLKWTKNNDSSEHLLFEKCPNNNRLSIHILIRAGGKNVEIKECKDKEIMKFPLFYFVNEKVHKNFFEFSHSGFPYILGRMKKWPNQPKF